ncbi:alpha-ketoglutarate decarboxylase [Psychroserpens burtonensis]|uniref:Alpha-ketoglutarate decarboxylase n=1 Tax=Psychroserpens burtonensis TaxID=49278 RepID=A0A5C7B9P3_9FLAO|nr:hypothetical protein [Psychroserpens burtonensis]TXE18117.1 alpha-ketoglutarate decarboxylase [Psychroserpens burtonensis]
MKICKHLKFKYLLILSLCAASPFQSFSQDDAPENEFWKHVRFNGAIGLSFGDGFFSGTLAPGAIYQFNEDFGLGMRVNGTYNKLKNSYDSTVLGASVISIFNPIYELQASVEFEYSNVNQKFSDSAFQDLSYWVPALFIGLGYRTNNIVFGLRYDVLYNENKSVYANPISPFITVFF